MRPSRSVRHGVLALVVFLAACATVTLRNPPDIEVTGVALERVVGADAYFDIDLVISNRAAETLIVDGLDGKLSIEGESIAEAALADAPVHVPVNGSARARMSARAGMDAVLRAIAAAMRRGDLMVAPGAKPVLHYTLEGNASFGGGARLPFRRGGDLGEARP